MDEIIRAITIEDTHNENTNETEHEDAILAEFGL